MSIAKKCDRCGKMYEQYNMKDSEENPNGIRLLNIDGRQQCFSHKLIDLCPDCMKQLQNWLLNAKTVPFNQYEGMCDKCTSCIHKANYQDEPPCCDCDPAGKASGYEGSDSKRRKLYVVMVRKCDNDACVRTYMITGDNNSSEDEVYNRAISNKDLFEYITVHEVDTTSDDYRIIVEDKSTGEEK